MRCPHCQAQLSAHATACEFCVSPVSEERLAGRVFAGRWELLKKQAHGGNGVIYQAKDLSNGQRVAVKVLQPQGRSQEEAIERFRREALAAGRLSHTSALKVYAQGQDGGLLWISMEWLEGETLQERLHQGPLSTKELWEVFSPLCEVLEEAHQKGITHRDLKPENVMLVRQASGASPVLLDFGLAGLLDAKTLTNPKQVSGTPKYMAPEQWESLSKTDPRSDIYSLGVMLYQCLSGRLPLEANSPLAWFKKHRFEAPLELREAMSGRPIAEGLCQVVMRSLAKNPQERQESARVFREELSGALSLKELASDTLQDVGLSEAMASTMMAKRPDEERRLSVDTLAPTQVRIQREAPPKKIKNTRWMLPMSLLVLVVGGALFVLSQERGATSVYQESEGAPVLAPGIEPATIAKKQEPESQPVQLNADTKPAEKKAEPPKSKAVIVVKPEEAPEPVKQDNTPKTQPATNPSLLDGGLLAPR